MLGLRVRGRDRVRHIGRGCWFGPKNQKLSHGGSVLVGGERAHAPLVHRCPPTEFIRPARSGEAHRAGVLLWAKKLKTQPRGLGFGRW